MISLLYSYSRAIAAATMSQKVTLQLNSAHAVLQKLLSTYRHLFATSQSRLLSNANAQIGLVIVHHAIAQEWSETFNRQLRASLICITNIARNA